MSQTVYVGMSGGVDSSVTAALLKQQGFDVVGVYMKNWTQDILGFECPWRQDLADAQSVAARLDIPLKIYDFEGEYKQKVVDYMIAEYQAGHTPNPDIMCNQEIKFKLFLETSLNDGADLIATGHYAITKNGKLYAGTDTSKDQSYFLYRVTSEALSRSLFPLGGMHKTEVRRLAQDFKLPVAGKKDSVGICFVGEVGIRDFLKQYVKSVPGPIKTRDGKEIGQHAGAVFYTIGQRHGLNVGGGLPYYVVGKDMPSNTVYVTTDLTDPDLHASEIRLTDVHWINDEPDLNKTYKVRTRHLGKLVKCKAEKLGNDLLLKLENQERAISTGQSGVLYDGDLVLGGGIITT